MEFGDIWKYYFISDIKEDRKLDEVVAFEENLIAECFIAEYLNKILSLWIESILKLGILYFKIN